MRKIGLLGGVTWHSTQMYYRYINEFTAELLGSGHSAEILLYSFDFEEIQNLQLEDKWEDLSSLLCRKTRDLRSIGAEILLIGANTLHKFYKEISAAADLDVLHIADAVAEELQKNKMIRAGLLGTRYTMEMPFYKDRLKKNHNISTIVPDQSDRNEINRIIYEELAKGIISRSSRKFIQKIIYDLKKDGAEAVILGCTELPLLFEDQTGDQNFLDTTYLHARYAVKQAVR